MISFQAKYVTSNFIKDNNNNNVPVNFVELDPTSKTDRKTLKEINHNWAKEHSKLLKNAKLTKDDGYLAHSIYNNFRNTKKETKSKMFFALTTQKDNFEKLNHKEVLGLTEVEHKFPGEYEINYLQTKPNCIRQVANKPFSKIGTSILKCIEEILPFKIIEVAPILEISEFYEYNGYKCNPSTLQLFKKK